MKKLVQGILDFRKNILPSYRETFAKLALHQAPDSLFIACSDSRVVPNLFASSDPGDLFVIRNVGNLVPPAFERVSPESFPKGQEMFPKEVSTGAAIEFSTLQLGVSDIIVCGHSHCGAMAALLAPDFLQDSKFCHLRHWLRYGEPSLEAWRRSATLNSSLTEVDQLSQLNVLVQMDHLKTYPSIQSKIANGTLRLHGWWFDIGKADVYAFEDDQNKFVLMDEIEVRKILDRLSQEFQNILHH